MITWRARTHKPCEAILLAAYMTDRAKSGTRRSPGACPGGFWRAGWGAGQRDQVIEIAADAAGGEPAGLAAAFPRPAGVFGEGAGQAQLGEGRGDQPGGSGGLIWPHRDGLIWPRLVVSGAGL